MRLFIKLEKHLFVVIEVLSKLKGESILGIHRIYSFSGPLDEQFVHPQWVNISGSASERISQLISIVNLEAKAPWTIINGLQGPYAKFNKY